MAGRLAISMRTWYSSFLVRIRWEFAGIFKYVAYVMWFWWLFLLNSKNGQT